MKSNRHKIRGICAALTAALTLTYAPHGMCNAAADMVYEQSFNAAAVNGVPEGVNVSGGKARVIESGKNNKAFEIIHGSRTAVTFPAASDAQKYIISFDISADKEVNAAVSVKSGTASHELIKISQNTIKTAEGREIGGVSVIAAGENEPCGRMTNVAIAVNRKSGLMSVYTDGRERIGDWRINDTSKPDAVVLTKYSDDSNIYIDNVAVYEGEELLDVTPTGAYNEDGEEFFSFTDDLGDFTFFHSSWPGQGKYPNNIKFYPKTNTIDCEAFDYKNPDKGDKIIFNKVSGDDAYIDVNCNIFKGYKSQKTYKYFKLSGEFMCNFDGGGSAQLFMLRDSSSSAAVTEYPVKVGTAGNVTLPGAVTQTNAAANNSCFKITMYLNLEDRTVTTLFGTGENWKYNNFRIVSKEAKLTNKLQNLNLVRFSAGSGGFGGQLQCRNLEVTGFDKAFIVGEDSVTEVNTSMFDFDKNMSDDLDGKICFQYNVRSAFANGEKYKISGAAEYNNNDFYISEQEFNKAYNSDVTVTDSGITDGKNTFAPDSGIVTGSDGTKLIPVKETVNKLWGFNVFDDDEGLIITSQNKIYFDKSKEVPYHKRYTPEDPWINHYRYIDRLSDYQYLYDYMLFDRPSKETLLDGYNRKSEENGSAHPSVMADKSDFDRVRELAKTDSYMKKVVDDLITQADMVLKQKLMTYKYDDSIRTLNTARQLESRMQLVGFAYQMTGDRKYAQYALDSLNQLSDFPDLNPVHIIDSGSYGTGIAVAYDWCYDAFTEEERKNICENVKRLYLSVFPADFYGRIPAKSVTNNDITICMPGLSNKWISNFNTWVNSGGVAMAIAFMNDYPEICSDFLSNSIRSTEYSMKGLYPKGGWLESSNYWYHVSRSLMYICSSLENVYGTDFNLLSFPGTEETAVTNMAIRSMVGNYNYHDAAEEKIYASHPMSYFGKHFNQRGVLAARRATIEKAFDERMGNVDVYTADALFYDPTVSADEISELPRVKASEGVELFSVHGDYKDYDSLFFASHGGPTTAYHVHNDNGDFVFDLNGVRWACALGSEDYNSSLPENEKYRKRPEGHNTIVINNTADYNQLANTYDPIIKSEEGEGGAYAVYDMSSSYADADSFKRGFYIGDNFRTLTVRDEIKLNKDNSEIYWFMHTTAEAYVLDERTVILSKDGECAVLQFETDAESAEVSVMDAVPLPSSPQGEGQTKNTGVRKVAIRLKASDNVSLSVRVGETEGNVMNVPIERWTAPQKTEITEDKSDYGYTGYVYGVKLDNMSYVPVISAKSLPEFKIEPHDNEKSAEVIYSDNLDNPNIVKIYSSDKSKSKIYILPYDTQRGIKELVYDEIPITNLSVSAEPQAENLGVNMLDNDFSTRWTTLNKGENAVFDIGNVMSVDAVAAGFWQSPVRNYYFDLYYSEDGSAWTKIDSYSSSAGEEEYQVFSFDRVNARYIKLIGNGCSANVNTNILEFRVLKRKAEFEHAVPDKKNSVLSVTITE